jgi:hypothetical protein
MTSIVHQFEDILIGLDFSITDPRVFKVKSASIALTFFSNPSLRCVESQMGDIISTIGLKVLIFQVLRLVGLTRNCAKLAD